ncbi:hypothetical protein D187_010156 [Cystobacter fuscus DSM 2262]|uniref:Uncharacterized protein n=1 Tax=Cystobacter fuscus (strain ATCC 25194 / DSM 2262 / NBRC 100088 / M29) TaxID=1242864 RepID=S9PGL9_CYSF2|nr:hypothetical protein D187_010156 [Cystobacter fuscus DSM 2262]
MHPLPAGIQAPWLRLEWKPVRGPARRPPRGEPLGDVRRGAGSP